MGYRPAYQVAMMGEAVTALVLGLALAVVLRWVGERIYRFGIALLSAWERGWR
jgi:hypothetical protein